MPRQTGFTRILDGDGITALNANAIGSAGFWVRSGDREYLATTGHVARSNNVDFYYVPWESEITNNTLIGKNDYTTNMGSRYRNMDNEEFPELQIIGVTDPDTEGTVVCKPGFTTHVTCGKIIGIRNTVTKFLISIKEKSMK
ncbi:hypothetical protein C2G38_2180236 [Gigaspora rosea]|uniref:Peptidase S1 domain-containing protein n=1 Tax=Gigaspora rosea TaxID=44941 RepID=A0A397VE61_9GLOM|nr:hypothetical protein C2G38_2180236 [Gigaspora rosea]